MRQSASPSMTRPHVALPLALVALTAGLVGCLGGDDAVRPNQALEGSSHIEVLTPEGSPAAFAKVGAGGPDGSPIALLTASANGTFPRAAIPATAASVFVHDPGNGSWSTRGSQLPDQIELSRLHDPARPPNATGFPMLDFRAPLTLGTTHLANQPGTCEFYNCGTSEPVLEVASDGSVYVSGTCCVGQSPPIWVSRELGDEGTFERLEGDVLRDNFGIEGDFSIDDAGNLYFTDISVASAYIASWGPNGEHRHTLPAGPFVPIVDRPWTRAGAEDVVHFFYNTGTATMYYKSTDGGLTWVPQHRFEGALGTPGQGPTRADLWVTADGQLHHSDDAGESWQAIGEIPRPSAEGDTFQAYDVPVVDDAGNVWIVYDWRNGTDDEGPFHVYATRYAPGDGWHGPYRVSPPDGTHHLPWAAAGAKGTLALAWYGTLDDAAGPNSVDDDAGWNLWTAASVDADAARPSFQRVELSRVHEGPMDRKLLDFLQVEIGPEGNVHIAYAQDRQGQPDEATEYVRTEPGLDLAPATYLNGP